MIRKLNLLAWPLCMLLASCTSVDIEQYDAACADGGCRRDLPGIPFNVKVPVPAQTTKWAARTTTVRLTGKPQVSADSPARVTQVTVLNTPDAEQLLKELKEAVNAGRDTDAEASYAALADLAKKQFGTAASEARYLVSNTVGVETVLSRRQHYFSPHMPLIGTSNAAIELSPDGTMTKASVQVQDQTLQTFLSMLPVKELITAALKPLTAMRGGLALTVESDAVIYTLKRVWPEPTFGEIAKGDCSSFSEDAAPLTIADALDGKCGTQVVSIASASQTPKADDKPAYSFSGKVTPPDK